MINTYVEWKRGLNDNALKVLSIRQNRLEAVNKCNCLFVCAIRTRLGDDAQYGPQ